MGTNCGLWRLPQENESSPVAVHPIPALRQSKFRDLNSNTQPYRPDYPMQSYLENRSPVIMNSHLLSTHEHCITSACGSRVNPTSTHAGSSQYVSPWRSVARWATNGAALKWIEMYGNAAERHAAMLQHYELINPPGQMNEKGLINPDLTSLFERQNDKFPTDVCSFSAIAYLSKMEQEYGQIAFVHKRPGRIAEPFPSPKVAMSSHNLSHSHDISVNPQRSPLSSSSPTRLSRHEMVSLPTSQELISANSGANVVDAQALNDPKDAFGANVAALQPVHDPKDDANEMPLVPVPCQESDNNTIPLDTQVSLVTCPVSTPRNKMIDISENPSWSP